jgi:transglutaminase-like putative cysteine protease
MLIRIEHETVLSYTEPVTDAVIEVRMSPPSNDDQTVSGYRLRVQPQVPTTSYYDGFGNRVDLFNVNAPHTRVEICSTSFVRTHRRFAGLQLAELPWPSAVEPDSADIDILEFIRPSPLVDESPELREFVASLPQDHRSFACGIQTLMRAVSERLKYEKSVTTAQTTLTEALRLGRGVCQDLAHLFIGACRCSKVPARYVSGYINQPGELATHAWCQIWGGPEMGWVDIDPTRGHFVDAHHVVIAVGRDFSDIAPNKGCWKGQGEESIAVKVQVQSVDRMPTNWIEHPAVSRPNPAKPQAAPWPLPDKSLRLQLIARSGPLRHQQSQQQQCD